MPYYSWNGKFEKINVGIKPYTPYNTYTKQEFIWTKIDNHPKSKMQLLSLLVTLTRLPEKSNWQSTTTPKKLALKQVLNYIQSMRIFEYTRSVWFNHELKLKSKMVFF